MGYNLRAKSVLEFLPFIVAIALAFYFIYVAIGWNVIVSISKWAGLRPDYSFSGFQQYARMVDDPLFWKSLTNTFFLFLMMPLCMLLGLLIAILLDLCGKGAGIFRNILLLPFALSFVVTGTLWAWMYAPSNGVINTMLRAFGLESLTSMWHTGEGTVMWSILLALIWQFSGYTALIFLAGIKSVDEDVIGAAKVDGASTFQMYRRVVLPQLGPSVLTNFVILMLFSLKAFDFIWVLTSGGPGTASHTLAILIYRVLFEQTQFAYGSAISVILLLIVLAIVVPYMYFSYRSAER